jgi:hypothetical protein
LGRPPSSPRGSRQTRMKNPSLARRVSTTAQETRDRGGPPARRVGRGHVVCFPLTQRARAQARAVGVAPAFLPTNPKPERWVSCSRRGAQQQPPPPAEAQQRPSPSRISPSHMQSPKLSKKHLRPTHFRWSRSLYESDVFRTCEFWRIDARSPRQLCLT